MTYEEALAKVLEVAGDYARISSTHDIEMTLYAQETAQLKNEIADIVKNLSLSPESIQLCVDGGEVAVEAFGKKVKAWRTVYESQLLKNAATEFPQYIERVFKIFIRDNALSSSLAVKDIQRFCGYSALIMNSITTEVTSNLTRIGERLVEIGTASGREDAKYRSYCNNLEAAMRTAANCWMSVTTIKPGMKLSIIDLRSSVKGSDIRRVKRARISDGEVVLAFENTASIVRGTSRINALESWLLNNPKFLEMAKVLKREDLQKLF